MAGRCGLEYSNQKCSKKNECCSKWGYCGTSEKHCNVGCQIKYGKCNITEKNTTKNKSSNKKKYLQLH